MQTQNMTLASLTEAIVDGVGDALGALLLAILTVLSLPGRYLWQNSRKGKEAYEELNLADEQSRLDALEAQKEQLRREVKRNNVRWEGDPDDPSQPGALDQLHNIESKIDEIRDAVDSD